MSKLRWWLWERLEWAAWFVCPDKKTLTIIRRVGTTTTKQILAERRAALAADGGNRDV